MERIKAIDYLLKGNDSNIFNLGTGVGHSVLEVINTSEKIAKKSIKKELAARRPGDPSILVASNKKAKEIIGWENKKDL